MSIIAMAWAWKQHGMTPGQKLVLMALADYADDEGLCYPGVDNLAAKCEYGRRTIISIIQSLEELGLLSKQRRALTGAGSGRGTTSNLYQLAMHDQCANIAHRSATNVQNHADQCAKTCSASKEEPSVEPSVYPPYPPQKKFPYLPDWVPADAWALFLRGRQEARASVPAWQIPLLLKQLDKLRKAGHDPGEVVEQSARAGYKDFFPVKGNATHQRNHPETAREHHARVGAYIDRLAGEAAAEILGQDAVREAEGDLRPGVDPPFWN